MLPGYSNPSTLLHANPVRISLMLNYLAPSIGADIGDAHGGQKNHQETECLGG